MTESSQYYEKILIGVIFCIVSLIYFIPISILGQLVDCLLKAIDIKSIWSKSIVVSCFASLVHNCHKVELHPQLPFDYPPPPDYLLHVYHRHFHYLSRIHHHRHHHYCHHHYRHHHYRHHHRQHHQKHYRPSVRSPITPLAGPGLTLGALITC